MYKIEVINIGDELLLGLRQNTHLDYLGAQFALCGQKIWRARVVNDSVSEIQRAVADAWQQADLVITTGGLGPTSDDLTREAVAQQLGLELCFDTTVLSAIQARFDRLGFALTEKHKKQCYVFKQGAVLRNDFGTAPGLYYEDGRRCLVMLPGPPRELLPMFEQQVLARLVASQRLSQQTFFLQLRTCGYGESELEALVEPIVAPYPSLKVAFCVHDALVDLRLSAERKELSQAQLKAIGAHIVDRLGASFVGFGEDSLAQVIYRALRKANRTVAVAESCTGGMLGNAFTDVPGISKVFQGGVICYTNEVKSSLLSVPDALLQQHGAVSSECAIAMATGAAERMSADYGLSITGYLGPGGGDAANPLGTVHLGFTGPEGVWSQSVRFKGGRAELKSRAVVAALDWMRRELLRAGLI